MFTTLLAGSCSVGALLCKPGQLSGRENREVSAAARSVEDAGDVFTIIPSPL